MATKSTKIRNSKLFKLLLIILSTVFFVGTYYYGQILVDYYWDSWNETHFFSLSSTDNVISNGASDYANLIRSETQKVKKFATEYKNEEYFKSGEGWAKKEAEIKELWAQNLEASILEEAKNWVEQQYYYDEANEKYTYPNYSKKEIIIDFSSEDQIYADSKYVTFGDCIVYGLTKRENGYYYKGFPLKYAQIDTATLKEENELSMHQAIATSKASYKSEYLEIKAELSSLYNYKYFLVNKNTGEIYTNMDGVKTPEDARAKYITDSDYFVSIINGDFENSKLIDKIYDKNVFVEYGKFEYCFGNLDPDLYDMVVFVDTTDVDKNPEDAFTSVYNDWVDKTTNLNRNRLLFAISFIGFVLTLILLVAFAGKKFPDGTVKLAKIDRVPNSIHFVFSWFMIISSVVIPMFAYMDFETNWAFVPSYIVAIVSIPAVLFLDEWLLSTSRQVKNRGYWKNTLTYLLIIRNWSTFKKWINSGIEEITHEEIKKNIFLSFIVYVALMAIFSAIPFVGIALDIVLSAFAFIYVRKLATGLDSISSALTKAEKGDYDFSVDVESMPLALKVMGENVNSLTTGFNIAVEDKIKEERTKTELITNVSHDLKTPLTSIITYTDLLKNCDLDNEQAKEYIGVLEEKSHRLKKLVEDLVEASKASSGNVTLNMTQINLNELVEQVYGEYEDDLKEFNLDLRMIFPDEPVLTVADGEKTYRIIDNLFSNVKKYALPNSRVYLTVSKDEPFAKLEMKNVSKDEMNFDVDRLCERFVRGDDSRSTEGAGLGLSIAKSLTEIQGGRFNISVDGDLFKVTIELPLKENA